MELSAVTVRRLYGTPFGACVSVCYGAPVGRVYVYRGDGYAPGRVYRYKGTIRFKFDGDREPAGILTPDA